MAIVPNQQAGAGIPGQWSETLSAVNPSLISGNLPDLISEDMTVAASTTIAAYQVVGLDGSGNVVPAQSGSIQAIGVAAIAATTPVGPPLKAIPIYRQGCFNPDAMVYHASYSTDELRMEAFRGAPSPTAIIVRKPFSGGSL